MPIKNNLLRSTFGLMMLLGIVFSLLAVPAISAVTYLGYLDGNSVGGSHKMIYLDYDFEKDELNSTPYMGLIGTDQANFTCNVTEMDNYGHLLHLNKTGTMLYWARLTVALGQPYYTGEVSFSWDMYNPIIISEVHGFQINVGAYSNTLPEHLFQIVNQSESTNVNNMVVWGETGFPVTKADWHNYRITYNFDTDKAYLFIDHVQKKEVALTAVEMGFINFACPSYLDGVATAFIDNIQLYTYVPDVYTPRTPNEEVYVSIMFDDGNVHDLSVAQKIMDPLPGCVNIVTSYIGNVGRLTWENVQYLHDIGWDVWSHSMSHLNLANSTNWDSLEQEIAGSKRAIEENTTFSPEGLVYPYNSRNDTVDFLVWDEYRYAATKYDGVNRIDNDIASFTFGLNDYPRYGVFRLARVLPPILYGSNIYMITYFHAIVDDANLVYGCNQSAFEWYIDILKAHDINVVAPSDILSYVRNAQNAIVSGNADKFTISFPTTYGNYTDAERVIISSYQGSTIGRFIIKDETGRQYTYTRSADDGSLVWVGGEHTYTITEFVPDIEYYSYLWVLIFILPGIILGYWGGKIGLFGGLIISTLMFGLTQTNGEMLLLIGLLCTVSIGVNMRGGQD